MNRRALIAAMLVAGFGSRVRAQQPKKRVALMGFEQFVAHVKKQLPADLRQYGFVEGRNLELVAFPVSLDKRRDSGEMAAHARQRAADVVASTPDCIVVHGEVGTRILQEATRAIPIVTLVSDPVAYGFAESLRRPGGNITGLHYGEAEVALKTAETLRQLMPNLACIGWIGTPTVRAYATHAEAAAKAVGIPLRTVTITSFEPQAMAKARDEIADLARRGCRVAEIGTPSRRNELVQIVADHGIALTNGPPEDDRFLFNYSSHSPQQSDESRVAAIVARILRGERPAEIPFEGPTAYEFTLNLRAAAKFGITIPPAVRVRADRVVGP